MARMNVATSTTLAMATVQGSGPKVDNARMISAKLLWTSSVCAASQSN